MRLPDFITRPTPATTPTPPTAARQSASSGGFGSLLATVHDEVSSFIQNGGPDDLPQGDWSAMASMQSSGQAASRLTASVEGAGSGAGEGTSDTLQQAFLESIAPWTEEAGQRLGVAPNIVAAHAALESGWGRKPLRQADGSDTNNLFGVKAGSGWQGDVANAMTTENQDGVTLKKVERFRSYADTSSAFRDYTQLLIDNPRYRGALNAGSDANAFAQGLARGGYATDQAYAEKLSRLATRLQSKE